MFVKCFTDEVVDEAYWPASFYFENTIRAILIEDGRNLCGLSPEDLQAELLRIGHGMGFPDGCPDPAPPDTWVAEFFGRECPVLVDFLNKVKESDVDEIHPADQNIAVIQETLQQCIERSNRFRDFLVDAKGIWAE